MVNNDTSTFLNNILYNWVGEMYNDDPINAYICQHPDNHIVVDIFPYVIENPNKYHQVEVFYEKWISKKNSRKNYLAYEKRYIDFLKTIWLYNQTDLRHCLSFDKRFWKGHPKKTHNKSRLDKCKKTNIYDWSTIEVAVSLALREAGFLWLYFQEWEIIAVLHDFSVQMLVKDRKTLQLIEPIIANCRLYSHY